MPWQDSWPHRSKKWYPESMTGWGSPHESTALPEVTSHKVMAAMWWPRGKRLFEPSGSLTLAFLDNSHPGEDESRLSVLCS